MSSCARKTAAAVDWARGGFPACATSGAPPARDAGARRLEREVAMRGGTKRLPDCLVNPFRCFPGRVGKARYQRVASAPRDSGHLDHFEEFGCRESDSGLAIDHQDLTSTAGMQYELSHTITMSGDRREVVTTIRSLRPARVELSNEFWAAAQRLPGLVLPAAALDGLAWLRTPTSACGCDVCGCPESDVPAALDGDAGPGHAPSKQQAPAGGTEVADSGDINDCEGGPRGWPGGEMGWLNDVRGALGVQQFRYGTTESFRGATASPRNGYGRQVIALHDGGIDQHRVIFDGDSGSRIVDGFVWGCRTTTTELSPNITLAETTSGWYHEIPPLDSEGHGESMAAVMIADGDRDTSVDGSTHTGMAPGAGVLSLGSDASDACGEATWDKWVSLYAVARAAEFGADVFVSARSGYLRCPDAVGYCGVEQQCEEPGVCGDDAAPCACNDWTADELDGDGHAYAVAIDAAFASGMLSVLSAGNNGADLGDPVQRTCTRGDLVPIGLGRSAYTAIPVGAMTTQYECSGVENHLTQPDLRLGLSNVERAAELQGAEWWYGGTCSNSTGPTADGRFYPLLLGYAAMCGVAVRQSWCGDEVKVEDDASYEAFGGSSAASATVAGVAIILKEWLESVLGPADGRNPAMLRVHLLNMGDRTGFSPYARYASAGIIRRAGFGKLRLRMVESCHFNVGALDYRAWTMREQGEVHTIDLARPLGESFVPSLPADLGRIKVCVWFELDSATARGFEDRPAALAYLQRQVADGTMFGTPGDWETVATSWTGHEYTVDDSNFEITTGRLGVRDPHVNLALDNEFGVASKAVTGGVQFRLVVLLLLAPLGEVRVHCSTLWETGNDPSLARNRATWICGSGERADWSRADLDSDFGQDEAQTGEVAGDDCSSC